MEEGQIFISFLAFLEGEAPLMEHSRERRAEVVEVLRSLPILAEALSMLHMAPGPGQVIETPIIGTWEASEFEMVTNLNFWFLVTLPQV